MTIILGIDPGSRITGYGLVAVEQHRVNHIDHGCLQLGRDELGDRLLTLFDGLANVIRAHQPQEAAIEKVFMNRNADSALKLGHARGVAMLCARQAGLDVQEYAATKIKQAIVGRGHAEKVFMNRNADSALKLGHARGVAMLCARQAGLDVQEYAATKIKQAIVGRGHAEKGQVQHMVKALLGLDKSPPADAADALAAAICHAHMREGIARIALAGGMR